MKTIATLASIAALVAFVITQFDFATSVSLFFAAGFAAIVVTDYTRPVRSLALRATAVPVALTPRERLGLAA